MFICLYCSYTWLRDRPYCPRCGCHVFKLHEEQDIEDRGMADITTSGYNSNNIEELEGAEGSVVWEI